MRVFAVSDLHVDYQSNADWVANISAADFRDDVLILAGDVTDKLSDLDWCLSTLTRRFKAVLFVPGNHDLWVIREKEVKTSLQKFTEVHRVVESTGAWMRPYQTPTVSLVPLLGWYDYSFGEPSDELRSVWMDYYACKWPADFSERDACSHFTSLNPVNIAASSAAVITFSHFLPRIELMPPYIPPAKRILYPVLGTRMLETQLRSLNASMHVYGHSHVNRRVSIEGVTYMNNAFGYPNEVAICAKQLLCVHES